MTSKDSIVFLRFGELLLVLGESNSVGFDLIVLGLNVFSFLFHFCNCLKISDHSFDRSLGFEEELVM